MFAGTEMLLIDTKKKEKAKSRSLTKNSYQRKSNWFKGYVKCKFFRFECSIEPKKDIYLCHIVTKRYCYKTHMVEFHGITDYGSWDELHIRRNYYFESKVKD